MTAAYQGEIRQGVGMEQARRTTTGRPTKKARVLALYDQGFDVESIADAVAGSTSYVANTLIEAGKPVDYEDLYTSTSGRAYSEEARRLSGVLRFKDVRAARDSVRDLDAAYREFAREGNRKGRHRAQMMALIGKNRAQGIRKFREAAIFRDWLIGTLQAESDDDRGDSRAA